MLFISDAFAQDAAAIAEPGLAENLIPLVLIFGIFYFLLIRPQHKKMKAQGEMVNAIKRNDKVVIAGGILGKVTKVEDAILSVEIAKSVEVQVNRSSVTDVLGKDEAKKEEKPAKKTKNKK